PHPRHPARGGPAHADPDLAAVLARRCRRGNARLRRAAIHPEDETRLVHHGRCTGDRLPYRLGHNDVTCWFVIGWLLLSLPLIGPVIASLVLVRPAVWRD